MNRKIIKKSYWLATVAVVASMFFPCTAFASPDFNVSLLSNDKYFETQYYLDRIHALDAWDIIKTSPNIVVAVIDSGVDIEHPDLAENIWKNSGEIPGDKIDNDQNGYADDVNGWDFVLNIPDPRPKFAGKYTQLGINHGTIVSGVIGAVGNNNFGISGVSWKIKIMPLKAMDGEGKGDSNNVIKAIEYAIQKKADIINLSMVGSNFDPLLDIAIEKAFKAGIIVVAAAGNENLDIEGVGGSLDLSLHPQYPICHDGPIGANYILGVGAVDGDNVKSDFSNYGSKCMDIMAPGESFFGTVNFSPVVPKFGKYFGGYWSGTSLAAPQVSGAAALLKAFRPSLTNSEIYNLLINNADKIDKENPDYIGLLGGGRLNIEKSIKAAGGIKPESLLVIGAEAGSKPEIKVLNSDGQEKLRFFAFAENFKGGVNLAIEDFNNDGVSEIVASAGKTGGPHIRVFTSEGQLLHQFFAYDESFTGGVNIAAGDVDGDGVSEIIASPQSGNQAEIRIFDEGGNLKYKIKAFPGGLKLALMDINASGVKNIAALSQTGPAKIWLYDAQTGKLINEFALGNFLNAGAFITSGNFYSDKRDELAVIFYDGKKIEYQVYSATGELIALGKLEVSPLDFAKALTSSGFNLIIK